MKAKQAKDHGQAAVIIRGTGASESAKQENKGAIRVTQVKLRTR